jgi:hypothetical protein
MSIINLTDIHITGASYVKLDKHDLVMIREALEDISKADVVVFILKSYEADTVLVNVDQDYLEILQEELEDYEVMLGDEYECA